MNRRSFLIAVLAQPALARLFGQTQGQPAAQVLPVVTDIAAQAGVNDKKRAAPRRIEF